MRHKLSTMQCKFAVLLLKNAFFRYYAIIYLKNLSLNFTAKESGLKDLLNS